MGSLKRYRVVGWNDHFEKNRTRELKRMEWVPVPNRMDGRGYTALVDHPNGAAHLGAWLAILEIASRSKTRGEIPQDGAGNLQTCLARISRLPAELFFEVIPRLETIGWIECYQQDVSIPQDGAGKSHDDAESAHYREGKGREGKGVPPSPVSDFENWFEEVYSRHPKKSDRGLAVRYLTELESTQGFSREEFDRGHQLWCSTSGFTDKGGQFAPSLAKFILDKTWKYAPPGVSTQSAKPKNCPRCKSLPCRCFQIHLEKEQGKNAASA